jgi:hypothetical protein
MKLSEWEFVQNKKTVKTRKNQDICNTFFYKKVAFSEIKLMNWAATTGVSAARR